MKWLMLRPSAVLPSLPPSHSRAESWPRAYLGGISPLHSDEPQRLRFFQGEERIVFFVLRDLGVQYAIFHHGCTKTYVGHIFSH